MASSTGGAVNSLRAMFEAKDLSSSPPSRGRSPSGISDVHSIRSTSSRPVSKIRTSFVAVEKSGQMGGTILGLRRVSDVRDDAENEHTTRPAISRSHSNPMEADIAEEKEVEKEDANKKITAKDDKQDSKASQAQVNEAVAIDTGSKGKPAVVKKAAGQTSSSAKGKTTIDTTSKPQSSGVSAPNSSKKQPSTPREITEKNKAPIKKPTNIQTQPSSNGLRAATNVKPRTSITSPRTPTSVKKPAAKLDGVTKYDSRTSTPRTSLAPSSLKENKTVKYGPKSPTKPGRLPAAAMAATASSAAKTALDQPSPRPSTKPRTSADGDFLARMMRPTTASANKIHEKVTPKSPPKTTPQKTVASRPKRISDAGSKSDAARELPIEAAPIDENSLCTYPGNDEPAADSENFESQEEEKVTVEAASAERESSVQTKEAANEHVESTESSNELINKTRNEHPVPDERPSNTIEDTAAQESKEPSLTMDAEEIKSTEVAAEPQHQHQHQHETEPELEPEPEAQVEAKVALIPVTEAIPISEPGSVSKAVRQTEDKTEDKTEAEPSLPLTSTTTESTDEAV